MCAASRNPLKLIPGFLTESIEGPAPEVFGVAVPVVPLHVAFDVSAILLPSPVSPVVRLLSSPVREPWLLAWAEKQKILLSQTWALAIKFEPRKFAICFGLLQDQNCLCSNLFVSKMLVARPVDSTTKKPSWRLSVRPCIFIFLFMICLLSVICYLLYFLFCNLSDLAFLFY